MHSPLSGANPNFWWNSWKYFESASRSTEVFKKRIVELIPLILVVFSSSECDIKCVECTLEWKVLTANNIKENETSNS